MKWALLVGLGRFGLPWRRKALSLFSYCFGGIFGVSSHLYNGSLSAFFVYSACLYIGPNFFVVQKNDDEEEETEEGLVREKRTSGAARQSTPRSLLKVCWSTL
jgi:hypothetical protein